MDAQQKVVRLIQYGRYKGYSHIIEEFPLEQPAKKGRYGVGYEFTAPEDEKRAHIETWNAFTALIPGHIKNNPKLNLEHYFTCTR